MRGQPAGVRIHVENAGLKLERAREHGWSLDALESLIEPAPYAFGNTVTLADLCLVPQVYNARRLKVPLDRFPKLIAVDAACAKLAAFEQARPENQPDAE